MTQVKWRNIKIPGNANVIDNLIVQHYTHDDEVIISGQFNEGLSSSIVLLLNIHPGNWQSVFKVSPICEGEEESG